MIDYTNAVTQNLISKAVDALLPGGDPTDIGDQLSQIVQYDSLTALSGAVFGDKSIKSYVVETRKGNFICELEGENFSMLAEHQTAELATLAALTFSMSVLAETPA